MATTRVNGWLLGLGAGLAGAWLFFRKGTAQVITLAQAEQVAMAHATTFVDVQRQAGFFVNIVGVLYRRTHTGKPVNMPQIYWDLILSDLAGRSQTLHYIQITIQYVPENAGGGPNLIYGIEQDGSIVFLAQEVAALINWF